MLLTDAVRRYINALLAEGKQRATADNARSALKYFVAFLHTQGITTVGELDHDALLCYREELAWYIVPRTAKPLGARGQIDLMGRIRGFCRYLVREDWLLSDPCARIPNPKKPQPLPRAILEPKEIDKILAQPDLRTARGYRDRAILELLYSTAMRREEVANLTLKDIDTDHGYVQVRQGKGGKDRVVPLGKTTCQLIDTYLAGVRAEWVNAEHSDVLFPNRWGTKMTPHAVWAVVHRYATLAGIKKSVSTHTFRHTCATHMLRNGAPIRHLQEMLGHVSLETTQIYTRVTINDLKAAHGKYHPREQPEHAPKKEEREKPKEKKTPTARGKAAPGSKENAP